MWNTLPKLNLALIEVAEGTQSLGGTTGPDLTRYFTVCGVLILVTAGVAWGLRRLISGNLKTRAAQRSLHIIDVLGLGGKRKLAVVRCYDRTFVVGIGEREVSAIAELDPTVGDDVPQPMPQKSDQAAFTRALEQVREAMPERAIETKALPAERKVLVKRKKAKPASAVVVTPVAAPAKRIKKTVRRAPATDQVARKINAQEVAQAAMQIAHSKQLPSVAPKAAVPKKAKVKAPVRPQTLSLEGIIG
ncbi:MAG: flagellar biogenesis protein FliO [Planctomycetota bacterium]|jgi:flagellar biogenesis protein FliO